MKWLHLSLNLISVLLLAFLGCVTATNGYCDKTSNVIFIDSTLFERYKGKTIPCSFSYRDCHPYLADKGRGITNTLLVNVPLATATGFGEYRPQPMARPDFVFIRFPVFNKLHKNRNE